MGELRIKSCVLITGKEIVYMIYGKTPFGNFFIVFFFFFLREILLNLHTNFLLKALPL